MLIILAAAILVWLSYITIFLLSLPVLILIFLNHSDEFIEHFSLSRLVEEIVDSDELSHICAVLDCLLVVLLELVDVVEAQLVKRARNVNLLEYFVLVLFSL